MKRIKLVTGFACVLLILGVAQSSMAAVKVPSTEQQQWLRWVIPLPKKIDISRKVELPASEVKITLRKDAGEVEKTAFNELLSLFKEKGKTDCSSGSFEILIGVCDKDGKLEGTSVPGAKELKNLANCEQAYIIYPVKKNLLALTASGEKGVYYAAQTLRQLLESKFTNGKVMIPLVRVTDWPDMAQRGEWGSPSWFPLEEVEWMAGHKMNRIDYHVHLSASKNSPVRANKTTGRGVYPQRVEFARQRALTMVPIISHLNSLFARGEWYNVYPELKGNMKQRKGIVRDIGESKEDFPVICPSQQSKLAEVLSQMMCSIASCGVTEIACWLSEGSGEECACENCQKEGHHALEARAFVAAWRIARKQYPKLRIRIGLTQGSYPTNDKVLAEIPPEVGVIYYDGGKTYNSTRDPMIYPLLENFAAKGGWLGVVPQLTASYAVIAPWTGPQFIKYRMTEFVDKKVRTLSAYATPHNRLYDFNVTAAAEWSWNAHGRSEHQFATAYATRHRIKDPDAFADWAIMLGPVSWDVYGSKMSYHYFRGETARARHRTETTGQREVQGKHARLDRQYGHHHR